MRSRCFIIFISNFYHYVILTFFNIFCSGQEGHVLRNDSFLYRDSVQFKVTNNISGSSLPANAFVDVMSAINGTNGLRFTVAERVATTFFVRLPSFDIPSY